MKYTSKIEVDENGEYFMVIPDELMQELDWKIDDNIKWVIEGDSVILCKEVSNNE